MNCGPQSCGPEACGEGNFSGRRFLTVEEKAERLQEYKEWLDSESKGVSEAITKLKKAS